MGTLDYKSSIINAISKSCAFLTVTGQHVCYEKGLLRLEVHLWNRNMLYFVSSFTMIEVSFTFAYLQVYFRQNMSGQLGLHRSPPCWHFMTTQNCILLAQLLSISPLPVGYSVNYNQGWACDTFPFFVCAAVIQLYAWNTKPPPCWTET